MTGMTGNLDEDLEEHPSAYSFNETLERLKSAIEHAGLVLFTTIDHAAGARAAGLSMPPTTVLLYGHPKGGTPVMLSVPNAALELPLRVLVREDQSQRTAIAFHPVVPLLARLGVSKELSLRLQPSQRLLVEALRD